MEEDLERLRDYPSYGQSQIVGAWKNKLIFAGTETNSSFDGHLEGALQLAEQAIAKITDSKKYQ
ncbi:hypothetical protein LYSBPC_21840 [Lysinibacillus piscis]|uniref:Amine oxidase domain-containing protein n=2 Tax=Lysinibacillus piscis TaxID=2518931 RepID=A0ABQ5NL84_9BACI|nr:hypothetical protein LYSBPC_21840 [Lysinibacillus sp. KH24]